MKFSIIMPTYNRPHTIYRTIKTIETQTYANWELIVSNNGKNKYNFSNSRIREIDSSEIASSSYARNKAIPFATGEIIGFFDDDDNMYPYYLKNFHDVFKSSDKIKMVRCGMHVRGNKINYSLATPEVMVRQQYVTPDWKPILIQDQRYFKNIIDRNTFSIENGDICLIKKPLCRANRERRGGLRSGKR